MNTNNNKYDSKSNIAHTLQDNDFIPIENTDPDAFINVLEDKHICRIVDDDDDNG